MHQKSISKNLLIAWIVVFLVFNAMGSVYVFYILGNGKNRPAILPDWYTLAITLIVLLGFIPSILLIHCVAKKEQEKKIMLISNLLIAFLAVWAFFALFTL